MQISDASTNTVIVPGDAGRRRAKDQVRAGPAFIYRALNFVIVLESPNHDDLARQQSPGDAEFDGCAAAIEPPRRALQQTVGFRLPPARARIQRVTNDHDWNAHQPDTAASLQTLLRQPAEAGVLKPGLLFQVTCAWGSQHD
jgi:hypothetical protein